MANSRSQRRLQIFFWIALGINLTQYAVFGVVFFKRFSNFADMFDLIFSAIYLALILFPGIFAGLAQHLVTNYFPGKEMVLLRRRMYNILGIVNILFALPIGAFGVYGFYQSIQSSGSLTNSPTFLLLVWTASMVGSSSCNIAVAVVVWRTVRVIKRNHRNILLESFN